MTREELDRLATHLCEYAHAFNDGVRVGEAAAAEYIAAAARERDEQAAELARLRAELADTREQLERERLRLAACGVVALADTPGSAKEARHMHPDYRSASCDDVARRVDECMRLRAELERARRLIAAAVFNDLSDMAADGVTVGAVWQKDALAFLDALTQEPPA